jgi:tRNA G18 (ribose-2'-O)-methylase SpoU
MDISEWANDRVGDKVALLLGSEGPGLSDEALSRVDTQLRIPMSDRVDSLNVAATAAIACFVLVTR